MNYNQLMKGVYMGASGATAIGTVAGAIAGAKSYESHPVLGGLGGAAIGNIASGVAANGTAFALTSIMRKQMMKGM